MGGRGVATTITVEAALEAIGASRIIRLPDEASRQLPSRGQVAVHVSLDGREFPAVVEPDGMRGHWLDLGRHSVRREVGDRVELTVDVVGDWPEPEVPADLRAALDTAPESIHQIWNDITPMARWEWVRWVNATANETTRRRRVEVSISKLDSGKRRPCCFDLSSCTDPAMSRSGKLRASDPAN